MLPIEPLLPELLTSLRRHGRLVLQAPPGAGKTTRVPLALAAEPPWNTGTVLVLRWFRGVWGSDDAHGHAATDASTRA